MSGGLTVPTYQPTNQNSAPMPTVRVSTDAPVEAFGGGAAAAGVGQAASQLGGQVTAVADQEKKKADQVAHLDADSQASQLETNIQVKMMSMRGKDAFGAPEMVAQQWKDGTAKIAQGLSNDQQKASFAASAQNRFDSLNKAANIHMATEGTAYDNQTTQGYIDNSRNSAVLNSFDPDKVENELDRQKAALTDWARRNGVLKNADGTDSEIFKSRVSDEVSNTSTAVIQNMLDNDKVDMAKDFFDDHKDEMNGQSIDHVSKLLESSDIMAQGKEAWGKVQNMNFPDGTPDEAKMQATINSTPGMSQDRSAKVWEYVKARAGEAFADKKRTEAASERDFMNQVYKGKQGGQNMDDTLKLADKFGTDTYDTAVKKAAIQKLYAAPDVTDPQVYMSLYDKVQNGSATKKDLGDALMNGQLKTTDWESLSKEQSKIQLEGVSPAQKVTWEQIKEEAGANISNKKDLATYLTAVQQQSQGKPPEEMYKISKDLLKKDPSTQKTIPWVNWSFGGQTQYKTDVEKSGAQSLAIGTFQQDMGASTAAAIGQGIQKVSGAQKISPADIKAFSDELGGYDKITPPKPGEAAKPTYNAIQSLIKRGVPVVPANIKALLDKHADGNY